MSTDAAGGDSTAAANDISKEEILRHIFGEIGELIEGVIFLLSSLEDHFNLF